MAKDKNKIKELLFCPGSVNCISKIIKFVKYTHDRPIICTLTFREIQIIDWKASSLLSPKRTLIIQDGFLKRIGNCRQTMYENNFVRLALQRAEGFPIFCALL